MLYCIVSMLRLKALGIWRCVRASCLFLAAGKRIILWKYNPKINTREGREKCMLKSIASTLQMYIYSS